MFHIRASIDDGQRFSADAIACNASLHKLISDHEPERRVILVARIACCRRLRAGQDIHQFVWIEGQPQHGSHRGPQVQSEIARVQASSKNAHQSVQE
jgi:hypothetical protein